MKKLFVLTFCLICFSTTAARAMATAEAAIIEEIKKYVLTTYPDWLGLEIKVGLKNSDRIKLGLEEFEDQANIEILETYKTFRPIGNVIFPIKVVDSKQEKKIFVRAEVEVFGDLVVAAASISRRQIIVPDLVKIDKRDIALLPQKYFTNLDQVIGKEAKTVIPKGSTIYEWMIKDIPLVHNGEKLMILVKGPNLWVKTRGVSLMDGYLGKMIKVKAENSQETLEGVLVAPDKVEVELK
ncbi:MAG: flagellar basal body P-ring formation chaperone FlgA [bacterium]|nr:flagellar basal body P-ring formation chaperone FlgA [Candidatus Margulisiibacteriota bacterium]